MRKAPIYKFVHSFLSSVTNTCNPSGILVFSTTLRFAQNIPEILPPSPNAASLRIYSQILVWLLNGLPEISIPIGNLQCSEVDLNISLGYHGGGMHRFEHPRWIGNGWSLNAGGFITRRVAVVSDELQEYGILPEIMHSY
jgi:hypothetical protein